MRRVCAGPASLRSPSSFAIGAPTTIIDAYNAQDIDDLDVGPGFHWTLVLNPDEQQVLHWIRTIDASERASCRWSRRFAIGILSPVAGANVGVSIPSFAERRMAAGLPISLMRVPEYARRSPWP